MSTDQHHPGHGYRIRDVESYSSLLHLTQRTYAMVLAGGRVSRLKQLTDGRAKPAVPFAGKLRNIDFALRT